MIVCICRFLDGACQEVRDAKPYLKIAFLTLKKADFLPAAQPLWLGRGDRGVQAPGCGETSMFKKRALFSDTGSKCYIF